MPLSINKVLATKTRLENACASYIGRRLEGEDFFGLVTAVGSEIPKIEYSVLVDSLRTVAGKVLQRHDATQLGWRLAGNMERLANGSPATPWSNNKVEWVPFQVMTLTPKRRSYKAKTEDQVTRADADGFVRQNGVQAAIVVLGGSPAGIETTLFWSRDLCERLKTAFGFSRFNVGKYSRVVSPRQTWPFSDPLEFFRLRAVGLVKPGEEPGQELAFSDFKGTAATIKWSRAVMLLRERVDFKCPFKYSDDFDCYRCAKGLEVCPAACHQRTYKLGSCSNCNGSSELFDRGELCIRCENLKE